MIAEIQSLVGDFSPGGSKMSPRRTADGFPLQRLLLICAVIEKRIKLPLFNRDVFLNVVGGLRVSEPSSDLAVAVSIVSSMLGVSVLPAVAFIGEIGLSGEVRGGSKLEQRVTEARQMGFTTIIVPQQRKFASRRVKVSSEPSSSGGTSTGVIPCSTLSQALEHAFGDGGFHSIVKRLKKVKSSSRSTLNSNDTGNDADGRSVATSGGGGGGRAVRGNKLYTPGEEAWMNEPSDMIPSYDDEGDEEEIMM